MPHFKRDGRLLFKHIEIINWMTENRVVGTRELTDRKEAAILTRIGKL